MFEVKYLVVTMLYMGICVRKVNYFCHAVDGFLCEKDKVPGPYHVVNIY